MQIMLSFPTIFPGTRSNSSSHSAKDDPGKSSRDAVTDFSPKEHNNRAHWSRLAISAFAGDGPLVRSLLQKRRISEQEVESAFVHAALKGHQGITSILIDNALMHTSNPDITLGKAIVSAACSSSKPGVLQLLLECPKYTWRTEHWCCAMKAAAEEGNAHTISLLLQAKSVSSMTSLEVFEYVVRTSASRQNSEIQDWIWIWLLRENLRECQVTKNASEAITSLAASFAHPKALEECLSYQCEAAINARYIESLMLAAVQSGNDDENNFRFLLQMLESKTDHSPVQVFRVFIAACKHKLLRTALMFAQYKGNLAMTLDDVPKGMCIAATSGQAVLLESFLQAREIGRGFALKQEEIALAFIIAARNGHQEVLRVLFGLEEFRKSDNLSATVSRALVAACETGQKGIVNYCIDKGADTRTKVLCPPSRWDFLEQHGTTVQVSETETRLVSAIQTIFASFRRLPTAEVESQEEHDPTTLELDLEEILSRILDTGCDLSERDEQGNSILQLASQWCSHRVIQALIRAGANINTAEGGN